MHAILQRLNALMGFRRRAQTMGNLPCGRIPHGLARDSNVSFPLSISSLCQLQEPIHIHALRPLNRQPERPIPNQLRHRPNRPTNPKYDRIKSLILESKMVQQHSTHGVYIGKRILGLAMLCQHFGCDFRGHLHKLEERVGGDGGAGEAEVHEGFEARVGAAEDGMAVAGDNLARFQEGPEVCADGGGVEGGDGGVHFLDEGEDFLGGKAGLRRCVSWISSGREGSGGGGWEEGSIPVKRSSESLQPG